jgi:hypothetical protein
MGLREIGWEGADWIHIAGSCEHGTEPLGLTKVGNFLTS